MTIECQSISFHYRRGGPKVLKDFTWRPDRGVSLLLGPNGAGKSTLLKVMASALRPTSGSVSWRQLSPQRLGRHLVEWRRSIGWIPQQVRALPGMTVGQQVAYVGWLKGMTRKESQSALRAALDRVSLVDLESQQATTLSGGQLRRLGIACALVHSPKVVLMDEPTAGLDPNQRRRLFRVINSLSEVDWIVATHQTEDLTMRASTISVIDHGTMKWSGAVADFVTLGTGATTELQALNAYHHLIPEER